MSSFRILKPTRVYSKWDALYNFMTESAKIERSPNQYEWTMESCGGNIQYRFPPEFDPRFWLFMIFPEKLQETKVPHDIRGALWSVEIWMLKVLRVIHFHHSFLFNANRSNVHSYYQKNLVLSRPKNFKIMNFLNCSLRYGTLPRYTDSSYARILYRFFETFQNVSLPDYEFVSWARVQSYVVNILAPVNLYD